ncbi:hypothetical protein SAMN02746091_00750 [Caloramator proteoclasticus DSM 10124]|uniref:Uncharacterized protein n=2 Tax=Clostridiaceae TaxID=31979 RepID=A0A1M4UVY8_9CLOT|nr:hypothetical protein SAMN02746091_00750 [Caloramator proteoclasticus DSM 10124]
MFYDLVQGGEKMEDNVEKVIQNIIHIDRSAEELRRKVDEDVGRKKAEFNRKIELMKKEIVDKKINELQDIKDREMKNIQNEEMKIIGMYNSKADGIEGKYSLIKQEFLKEVYCDIFFEKDR